MKALLSGIVKNNFLVVGRVGMDAFPDPPGSSIEEAHTYHVDMGGSSANTAAGIVKLGGRASLLTRVSDDAVGRFCQKKLVQYGVGDRYVTPVAGERASEYRNSIAFYESRVEDHQSVIYRNGAADFQMDVADVDAVDFSEFGAVVTAGTVFAAEPSRTASFHAFEKAKAAGLPVIFDVDYRPYSWASPQVASDVLSRAGAMSDMIVGNDEEFGFMAGSMDKGLDMARHLAHTSASLVIYKMGHEGSISITKDSETRNGIFKVDALKPTGAGDSFMSGLLAALADGHDLRAAVQRGSACAAIVVAKPGCAPAMPYPDELNAFMESRADGMLASLICCCCWKRH
ncbi:MAG: 5-dehydro-2-deoxygluconokinase, partial [Pseudomonadota bacterium]